MHNRNLPKTYDSALPQNWFDKALETPIKINPLGHVVWSYDNSMFGEPHAVDDVGKILLQAMGEE